MSPASLHLFPAPTSTLVTPLPSLGKMHTNNANKSTTTFGEVKLNGVVFQVAPKDEPGAETINHSLFCAPVLNGTTQSNQGPVRRQSRTRRRSGHIASTPLIDISDTTSCETDELTALPTKSHFGFLSPLKRSLSSLKRPNPISTAAPPAVFNDVATTPNDEDDRLSLLPPKTRFTPPSPSLPDYSPPMRSMFPTYDPNRPLDGQNYYPTSCAPPLPRFQVDQVSDVASLTEKTHLKRYDSAVGLINGYEHIPAAVHTDLEAVWKASEEEFPCAGRKVQFSLYQPAGHGTALSIGTSQEDVLYSLDRDVTIDAPFDLPQPKEFAVQKHCPTSPSSTPAAQLILPSKSTSTERLTTSTAIFPRKAAIAAIESISRSPQACAIATFDPTAQSPQAASMAQSAVAVAYQNYSCDLINKTRKQDGMGAVVAQYDLRHPALGICAITVTKSSAESLTGPRAKIAFHHPSATPAAVEADTLNLAFLDFAQNACVLDVPGLLALDSRYIVDTVVCALLAVAVIENDALIAETLTFEAPPRTPLHRFHNPAQASEDAFSNAPSKKLFKRSESKKGKRVLVAEEPEQVKLPLITKGAIKIAGVTFKVGFWGAKVGAKAMMGVGRVLLK